MKKPTIRSPARHWTLRKYLLLGFGVLMACGIVASYVLAALSMDPNASVTEQLIVIFGGAFVGYLLADTADHHSLNRTGAQAPEDTEGDE